ncbi:MAG: hypothetical protein JSV19_11965 [Phycisphaerales bacterium]|nr:MAG: hypothetical protein JSV19_11965 [Phycisphaerales bacterium]
MRLRLLRPTYAVLATVPLLFTASGEALGQSTAPLTSDPGSSATLTLHLELDTSLGMLSGSDSDTANATGTGMITVFPTSPPFADVLVHSMSAQIGTLEFHYRFVLIVTIDITVYDLTIEATDAFAGPLDGNGDAFFPAAPVRITGSAHVVCPFFGVDRIDPIDTSTNGPVSLRVTEAGGIVILDQIELPVFVSTADPGSLPPGVTSQVTTVVTDAANLVYRGAYGPSLLGDWNADGDVDLADYQAFAGCHLGPTMSVDVTCTLFDFDGDVDVDVGDFAAFQAAFTGP